MKLKNVLKSTLKRTSEVDHDLSYGQNAKFGHADYYGNKAAGRSIKDIYDYVTRNQYVLAENNRFGGVDGLSDEIGVITERMKHKKRKSNKLNVLDKKSSGELKKQANAKSWKSVVI